jgi:hypothetical protein
MALVAGGAGLAVAVFAAPGAAADELLPDCDESGTVIDADGPTNCANPGNVADVENYPVDEAHYGFPSHGFFP